MKPRRNLATMVAHLSHPANVSNSWKRVKYRLSSVVNPQSNGSIELVVKTVKMMENSNRSSGYIKSSCKTPIQGIGLFPAQLKLHCWIYDFLPSQPILNRPHPKWITAVKFCEANLYQCNAQIMKRYNRYTHNLCQLRKGDTTTSGILWTK